MANIWSVELWRIAGLLAAAFLFGLLTGAWLLGLCLVLLTYLGFHLYHLSRLHNWLRKGGRTPASDVGGIWGEVCYGLHRLQERHRKRKRKLSNILNRFKASTSAMPDATVVLRRNNEIEWFNEAARKCLGLRGRDVGQRIVNLIRFPVFVRYLQAGDFSEPLVIPSPVDGRVTLSIRVVPYARKQRLLVARDMTRQQRLEDMRRDFVANVSHELRTPITVVNGYLETLMDDPDDDCARQWSRPLMQMHEQTTRMMHIVNDLLTLSKLESEPAPGHVEDIDMPALLEGMVNEARLLSEGRHHIELEAKSGEGLRGDSSEIRSVVANLLGNAVKYTPEGGHIKVRWYADEQGRHLEVSDDGPGIEARHLPRLTERFYRVDVSRSRASGGTGLGLAIVKHILNRHDADLHVESRLGEGSTFRCDFPPHR